VTRRRSRIVTRPPVTLADRLEFVAAARWSWSTYRHLRRPKVSADAALSERRAA